MGEIEKKLANKDLKIQRRGQQQDRQKTIGFISKTTTLPVHHTCLYISLPFLHEYDVKMPTCDSWGMETNNDEILFPFLNLDKVPRNSTSGGFAYI